MILQQWLINTFEGAITIYGFNLKLDQITTIIHPESIVHSMVEFNDYSIYAQLGVSDMKLPIQYALNYPNHINNNITKPLDLEALSVLHFNKMDESRFKAISLARTVIEKGGFYPVVFNASNEELVRMFLNKEITIDMIVNIIEEEINRTEELYGHLTYNLENILKVDELVKKNIKEKRGKTCFGLML